jgi:hypothetical protein
MPEPLETLRENLLRAGLAPRHVERYLAELSDHCDDIAAHLQQAGLPPDAARLEAVRRLGNADALLLPMLANPRFRSPVARWPALFYLLLPLVAQAGLVLLAIGGLALAASTPLRPGIADLGTLAAMLLLISPVLIAWLAFPSARRRRLALRWPLACAFAGALFAAALQLDIIKPSATQPGIINLAFGIPALVPAITLLALSTLPLWLRPIRS